MDLLVVHDPHVLHPMSQINSEIRHICSLCSIGKLWKAYGKHNFPKLQYVYFEITYHLGYKEKSCCSQNHVVINMELHLS